MRQSRRTGTGREVEIKPGDIVRLLQPFRPERYCFRQYAFGVVAGVVKDGSAKNQNHQSGWETPQTSEEYHPEWDGLVVYLYEPDNSTTYADQFGVKALFSFDFYEVELYEASQTPVSE